MDDLFELENWKDDLELAQADDRGDEDYQEHASAKKGALAQLCRAGELYVTLDDVDILDSPECDSGSKGTLESGTVILLAPPNDQFPGFRDSILPIRGWLFIGYDRDEMAFRSMQTMSSPDLVSQPRSTNSRLRGMSVKNLFGSHKKNKNKRKDKKRSASSANMIDDKSMDNASPLPGAVGGRSSANAINQRRIKSDADLLGFTSDPIRPPLDEMIDIDNDPFNESTSDIVIDAMDRQRSETVEEHSQTNTGASASELMPSKKPQLGITVTTEDNMPQKPTLTNAPSIGSEFSVSGDSRWRRQKDNVQFEPARIEKIKGPKDEDTIQEEIMTVEEQTLTYKIMNSKIVKETILFVRKHPAILTLIFIAVTGVIEGCIFGDLVTDIMVLGALGNAGQQIVFALSGVLVLAPYFIAWASVFSFFDKKRDFWHGLTRYKWFTRAFAFAPFGVIVLFCFDVYTAVEYAIIRPIYFFVSRGQLFRNETLDEKGYKKLRRVSEVCAESVFQAIIQLAIFLVLQNAENKEEAIKRIGVTPLTISSSLFFSFFIIGFWMLVLKIESSMNGLTFVEYVPIVLQGSFKFVPFLPAIERGTKNGRKVNWTGVKLDNGGIAALGQAMLSPTCKLETVKVSSKTFKHLNRAGCKYIGRLFSSSLSTPVEIIVSRSDKEIYDLFDLFDISGTSRFDFDDFCRASLALRAADGESLQYDDISGVFRDLATNEQKKVWLLDLLVKVRSSKERVPIVDVDNPLDHSVRTNDVKLLTFCMAYGMLNPTNEASFRTALVQAVTTDQLAIAHAMTENEGIPIVVEVLEGQDIIEAYRQWQLYIEELQEQKRKQLRDIHGALLEESETESESSQDDSSSSDGMGGMSTPVPETPIPLPMFKPAPRETIHLVPGVTPLPKPEKPERQHYKSTGSNTSNSSSLSFVINRPEIFVEVCCFNLRNRTDPSTDALHNFWNHKLLFIIPFDIADDILRDPFEIEGGGDTLHRLQSLPDVYAGNTPIIDDLSTPLANQVDALRKSSDDSPIELDGMTFLEMPEKSPEPPLIFSPISILSPKKSGARLAGLVGVPESPKQATIDDTTPNTTDQTQEDSTSDEDVVGDLGEVTAAARARGVTLSVPETIPQIDEQGDSSSFNFPIQNNLSLAALPNLSNVGSRSRNNSRRDSRRYSVNFRTSMFQERRRGSVVPGLSFANNASNPPKQDDTTPAEFKPSIDFDLSVFNESEFDIFAGTTQKKLSHGLPGVEDTSTFLGACNVSIDVDVNALETMENYHRQTHKSAIKVSRKQTDDRKVVGSLKYKVYLNALAAYYQSGMSKNWAEKYAELKAERRAEQIRARATSKAAPSPHLNVKSNTPATSTESVAALTRMEVQQSLPSKSETVDSGSTPNRVLRAATVLRIRTEEDEAEMNRKLEETLSHKRKRKKEKRKNDKSGVSKFDVKHAPNV